jgi:hypothetical protein
LKHVHPKTIILTRLAAHPEARSWCAATSPRARPQDHREPNLDDRRGPEDGNRDQVDHVEQS